MKLTKKDSIDFLLKITILSGILFGIMFLLFTSVIPQYYLKIHLLSAIVIIGITYLFHILAIKVAKKDAKKFMRHFMSSTMIRFFIYTVYLGVVIFLNKPHALNIVLYFLATYIIYTTFEIKVILNFLKKE